MKPPTQLPILWLGLLLAVSWPLAFFLGKNTSAPEKNTLTPTKSQNNPPSKVVNSSRPDLAITAAARTLSTMERIQSLQTREDFQAAIADIIKFNDKSEKEGQLALLFGHWLETNPGAALLETRRVAMLRIHGRRIALAFEDWARNNPSQAAQLLAETLAPGSTNLSTIPFRDKIDPPAFILSLFSGLAQSDPLTAANVLASAPESLIRSQSLSTLTQIWFQQNPTEAYQWAASIPDNNPTLRQEALLEVATRAGLSSQPQSGIGWADTLPNPKERTRALQEITKQWSQQSAHSAYDWASSLPDSDPAKFEVMPSVIRRLTLLDPGLAANWLNQYDPSLRMDQSVAAYIRTLKAINPTAAQGSLEGISSETLRAKIKREFENSQ